MCFARSTPLIALLLSALTAVFASAAEQPNIIILFADDLGYGPRPLVTRISYGDPTMKNILLVISLLLSNFAIVHAGSPNVLFIAIDDLNDWVGCLDGHPQVTTPNIDALAQRGTLFTNAHCQAPICNPSRTSVMTGLRPSTTGVYALAPWFRTVDDLKELVTLPQHFSGSGYTTYTVGKIYHGREWNSFGRERVRCGRPDRTRIDAERETRGDSARWPWNGLGCVSLQRIRSQRLEDSELGCRTARSNAKGPFSSWRPVFLCLTYLCTPLRSGLTCIPKMRSSCLECFLDDRNDTPRFSWYLHWKLPEPRQKFLLQEGEQIKIVQAYLASVSFVDSQVGRVLDALERNDLADDTIVVLWSDHGYHLGEKQITGKNTLWDRSARVPLIFAGPGVKEGQKSSRPAELLDMYPTLSELCGLKIPDHLEGLSLVPQLQDANASRTRPAITTDNHDNHGLRTERWRYIRYADGSEELYDMVKDANEFTNLAADSRHSAETLALRKQLPKINKRPVAGSAKRILIYENGVANWEGEDIHPNEAIPD